MREEKDSIGSKQIPADAFYGIHALRALENFPLSNERVNLHLIKAYLLVKKAAAETNYQCKILPDQKYRLITDSINDLINETDLAVTKQSFSIYEKVIVDPYQGGAGTSLNLNINEIIANTSLKKSGKELGDYSFINPIDDVNLSQSTNDTFITALKIASIYLLRELTSSFAFLQRSLQLKEKQFAGILKLGRTQLQDAVPMTLGSEFGAYAQAVARDRWRLYNCEERLRSVNLGGTAIGNSITASREYVLKVNTNLRALTGLPLAKADDLIEATQNLDMIVEVHGLIKAGACSIIKICNDLRLLSSGPHGGIGEIILPALQAGSSIMPGKVNPVILENAIQISELIKGHDVIISNLVSAGNLELNSFTPMITHLFLKSIEMLRDTIYNLADKCINNIEANKERCKSNLLGSSAIAASLINKFGYDTIARLVKESEKKKVPFFEICIKHNLGSEEEIMNIILKETGI